MKKMNFSLSKRVADHLIQAFLIFASVFLAFWLSDYRQNQVDKKLTKNAIEAVINEIENNKAILERVSPVLRKAIASTESFLENHLDTVSYFSDQLLDLEDLRFSEPITNDSYAYLNQNNIAVELNKRLMINRIYKQQEFVENAILEYIQFYKQRELFNQSKTIENYVIFFNLLMEMEGQINAIIREYGYVLNELKK